MILPYLVRLFCLSLAGFFLIHLALGLGVNCLAPAVLALAKRIRPRAAAGLLLAVRLFPAALAALIVVGICVPSYLWLEPEAVAEHVGLACLAAALLGATLWGISAARGLHAVVRSLRYLRYCERVGQKTRLAGESAPVWVVDGAAGLLALAGIVRPRLVIGREVVSQLSADELSVALRHERAHRSSRDNLKRLLLLLAPDLIPFGLPFRSGFRALEHGWMRFTEWAADDRAVAGDSRRCLSLAAALVRVARMGAAVPASPLMTSLVADGQDLEARVERLLGRTPSSENAVLRRLGLAAAALLLAGLLAALWIGPATLYGAHRLLEHLIA